MAIDLLEIKIFMDLNTGLLLEGSYLTCLKNLLQKSIQGEGLRGKITVDIIKRTRIIMDSAPEYQCIQFLNKKRLQGMHMNSNVFND